MTREEEVKFRDECAMRQLELYTKADLKDQLNTTEEDSAELRAKWSFEDADAMLEEKKKRDEKLS